MAFFYILPVVLLVGFIASFILAIKGTIQSNYSNFSTPPGVNHPGKLQIILALVIGTSAMAHGATAALFTQAQHLTGDRHGSIFPCISFLVRSKTNAAAQGHGRGERLWNRLNLINTKPGCSSGPTKSRVSLTANTLAWPVAASPKAAADRPRGARPPLTRTLPVLLEPGKLLERTGLCSGIAFTRYVVSGRKQAPAPRCACRSLSSAGGRGDSTGPARLLPASGSPSPPSTAAAGLCGSTGRAGRAALREAVGIIVPRTLAESPAPGGTPPPPAASPEGRRCVGVGTGAAGREKEAPALLWLWVVEGERADSGPHRFAESHGNIRSYLAREGNSVAVLTGYRLAPEHKYPAAYEDCLNATIHFMKNAEHYGVDPVNITVCGDSAGGNLAAAVSQTLAGRSDLPGLRAQVLIYPGLQALDFNLPSYQQNRRVPLLFRERAAFYMLQYLDGNASNLEEVLEGSHIPMDIKLNYGKWVSPDHIPEKFKVRGYKPHVLLDCSTEIYETVKRFCEPNLCPLLAEDAVVQQLPQSFILTCEYDVLRDDGLLYKKRLEDNGVPVTWYHLEDGFHGIISLYDYCGLSFPSGKRGLDRIVKFIKGL